MLESSQCYFSQKLYPYQCPSERGGFFLGGETNHDFFPSNWQKFSVSEFSSDQISKNPNFHLSIARFYSKLQQPGIKKDARFYFIFHIFYHCQIWLNLLMDDCHFSCISKLEKSPALPCVVEDKLWQLRPADMGINRISL